MVDNFIFSTFCRHWSSKREVPFSYGLMHPENMQGTELSVPPCVELVFAGVHADVVFVCHG